MMREIAIIGDNFMLPEVFREKIEAVVETPVAIRTMRQAWPDEPMEHGYAVAGLDGLKEYFGKPDEIVEVNLLRTPHGYPIFGLGFEPHLEKVNGFVKALENVQTTGRQGGFCYPNMHKAMRMGADAADKALARLQSAEQTGSDR